MNKKFKFIELPTEEHSLTNAEKDMLFGADTCNPYYSQCPNNPAYSYCMGHTNNACDCGGTMYCTGHMIPNN